MGYPKAMDHGDGDRRCENLRRAASAIHTGRAPRVAASDAVQPHWEAVLVPDGSGRRARRLTP